jgi:hypothetical protein
MAARVNLLASHAVAADTLRDDTRCSAADCDDAGAYAIGDADRPARSARVPAAAERDIEKIYGGKPKVLQTDLAKESDVARVESVLSTNSARGRH